MAEPYEYLAEARAVASGLANIKDLITDGTPDEQQIIQYLAELAAIVTPIQAVLSAEDKIEFKAKFGAVIGATFLAREARKLEDGQLKDNLLELADTLLNLLAINVPDEPNA